MCSSTIARSTATSSACGASSAGPIPSFRRARRSMARSTASPMADRSSPERSSALRRFARPRFPARTSLTTRILAFNIIALALLGGSFFYLDNYRRQLLDERFHLAASEAQITGEALLRVRPDRLKPLMIEIGQTQKLRLRLYDRNGKLIDDSFELAQPSFRFVDPAPEPWLQAAARL